MQRISDLHSKFALRPHHVWKYGKHPMCGLGEEKDRKKSQDENMIVCPIP